MVGSKKVRAAGFASRQTPLVIENHNAIKRAVEDGLVFALGGIEDVHSLPMFAASQKKEANMEDNCDAESDQDEREQQGGQRPAIESAPRTQPRAE